MNIVLNEYDWAESMIKSHDLGKKPYETLCRVAKYYYANHHSKAEVRRLLEIFLVQCDPDVSLVSWSKGLDRIVRSAEKYPISIVDGVGVSSTELEKIAMLEKRQLQRFAFTLLCVAKYWDAVSPKNNHWVNSKDKEVMRLANIGTSIERQSAMFGDLISLGYIKPSKKIDNLNVQVLFIDNMDTRLYIRDFRNIGYQYMKYLGGDYFECANCGIVTKARNPSTGRKQKYCPACAVEIHTKQVVDAVMRRRYAQVAKSLEC